MWLVRPSSWRNQWLHIINPWRTFLMIYDTLNSTSSTVNLTGHYIKGLCQLWRCWCDATSILRSGCVLIWDGESDSDTHQTDIGGDGCLSSELSTVRHGTNGGCAVLISYMALAEDEEIGRSEKDPSLGEEEGKKKTEQQERKKAVTQACRGENVILTLMLLLHYTQRYMCACACTCAGLRPSAPPRWWARPHSERFSWPAPCPVAPAPAWWCAGPAPRAPLPAESPAPPVNTTNNKQPCSPLIWLYKICIKPPSALMNNAVLSARSGVTTTALPRAQARLNIFIQFEGLLIKLCWLFV